MVNTMVIIWLMMVSNDWLVVGPPTPLKNDGVRQLGLWPSQYMEKNVPNQQPDTQWNMMEHYGGHDI